VRATGDILVRGEIRLLLKDRRGIWKPVAFLADSGTEMTTMPAAQARQLDVPFPAAPIPGLVHNQTGLPIRAGSIRVRVAGMDATEYVFPCYFLGDPHSVIPMFSQPGQTPRDSLGVTGVIDKLRICLDGDPCSGAPYGYLIVEKK
jgi:hypothetical protein